MDRRSFIKLFSTAAATTAAGLVLPELLVPRGRSFVQVPRSAPVAYRGPASVEPLDLSAYPRLLGREPISERVEWLEIGGQRYSVEDSPVVPFEPSQWLDGEPVSGTRLALIEQYQRDYDAALREAVGAMRANAAQHIRVSLDEALRPLARDFHAAAVARWDLG